MTPQLFTQPNYPSTNNFVPHINTSFFSFTTNIFCLAPYHPYPTSTRTTGMCLLTSDSFVFAVMCLLQCLHLCQLDCHVPTHQWPAMSCRQTVYCNCPHLCQLGCHVPTTSVSLVLLPCAYLNAITSVSTAAMCLLITGLQCLPPGCCLSYTHL